MRTRLFITGLLLALLAFGGAAGDFALAQKEGDTSSRRWLLVEVTDERGQPVKRACVTLVPREGEIIFRNADSRGRVRLKRLPAGRYRVTAKGDGYELQGKEVTVGPEDRTVAFSLRPRVTQ